MARAFQAAKPLDIDIEILLKTQIVSEMGV